MKLNKLSLRDKALFNKYLGARPHQLSVYAFENIYIWKGLFDIFWGIIGDNLYVFFKDSIGCFLYLSPLGEKITASGNRRAFEIMDKFNRANKDISRIENAQETDLEFYRSAGFVAVEKYNEYLCSRRDLAELKGDRFRHKRACCNYFVRHYEYEYLPFSPDKHQEDCLKLYRGWAKERISHNPDPLYQGMIKDSQSCLKVLLNIYQKAQICGRVLRVNKKIKGFSFGFALNKDIFCILYEITDLSIKGAAQFIFRQFCRELTDYKYINIMDDSGLKNLKQVKLSYRPEKLVPAYIIKRKDGY